MYVLIALHANTLTCKGIKYHAAMRKGLYTNHEVCANISLAKALCWAANLPVDLHCNSSADSEATQFSITTLGSNIIAGPGLRC